MQSKMMNIKVYRTEVYGLNILIPSFYLSDIICILQEQIYLLWKCHANLSIFLKKISDIYIYIHRLID